MIELLCCAAGCRRQDLTISFAIPRPQHIRFSSDCRSTSWMTRRSASGHSPARLARLDWKESLPAMLAGAADDSGGWRHRVAWRGEVAAQRAEGDRPADAWDDADQQHTPQVGSRNPSSSLSTCASSSSPSRVWETVRQSGALVIPEVCGAGVVRGQGGPACGGTGAFWGEGDGCEQSEVSAAEPEVRQVMSVGVGCGSSWLAASRASPHTVAMMIIAWVARRRIIGRCLRPREGRRCTARVGI